MRAADWADDVLDDRGIAEQAPVMIRVCDPAGACVYLNARWRAFTGQPPERGLGSGWLEVVHPEDRELAASALRSAHERQELSRCEYRLRRADGAYSWVIDTASPRFDHAGAYLGSVGVLVDITERRRAEEALQISRERLDLMVDGAGLGVWFCDLPLSRLEWNTYVKEHFHLPPEAEVTVDLFYERLHPEDRERTRQAIEAAIADCSTYDIEYRTISPDGARQKWIRAIGRVFPATADRPARFDGITIDVTDRKEAEEQYERLLAREQRAREEAESALRARDVFLSVAAHELRTPLTTLKAYAQLLERQLQRDGQLETARVERALRAFVRETDKLERLIGQLLDVSRIEAGRLRVERQRVDLSQLLGSVVADVRRRTGHQALSLQAPPRLLARLDPLRIEQVLLNLLDNAIRYSPAGSPIEVEAEALSRELCELRVRDHGEGIPPNLRARVFERFFQAHGQAHRSGMGLGLFISRQIVELHGGTLRAEFPPDGGTCFVICLPRALEGSERAAAD